MFYVFQDFQEFVKDSGERDEGPSCSKSLRGRRSAKEPGISPAESALRIAPVCKEAPAEREQGPRDHRVTVLICTHRLLRHQEECEYCTSSTTCRGNDRERSKEGRQCDDTDWRKGRRESCNQGTRESLDYGRSPSRQRGLKVR